MFVVAGGHAQHDATGCTGIASTQFEMILAPGEQLGAAAEQASQSILPVEHLPRAAHYFNVMHPSDPVAYRFEPLILGNAEVCSFEHPLLAGDWFTVVDRSLSL